MKATILLALALFLAAAPDPDPDIISEMTARFIVLDQPAHLQAAESPAADSNEELQTATEPASPKAAPTDRQELDLL